MGKNVGLFDRIVDGIGDIANGIVDFVSEHPLQPPFTAYQQGVALGKAKEQSKQGRAATPKRTGKAPTPQRKARRSTRGGVARSPQTPNPRRATYSKANRSVAYQSPNGRITTFTEPAWARTQQIGTEWNALLNDRRYAIPFIPEKQTKITIDKGSPTARARGAVISTNMLDSIAVNAQRAGIPFRDAIGMVSRESTLGSGNRRVGMTPAYWMPVLQSSPEYSRQAAQVPYQGVYSPTLLVSDWDQWKGRANAPYAEFFYDKPKDTNYYKDNFGGSFNLSQRVSPLQVSPLYHAFKSYKENPKDYNHGNPRYPEEVRAAGNELVQYSPQVRQYMKENNIQFAGGGYLDGGQRSWDSLSMAQKSEIMKEAIANGIYTLDDIKKAYESGGAQAADEQSAYEETAPQEAQGYAPSLPEQSDFSDRLVDNQSMPWESPLRYDMSGYDPYSDEGQQDDYYPEDYDDQGDSDQYANPLLQQQEDDQWKPDLKYLHERQQQSPHEDDENSFAYGGHLFKKGGSKDSGVAGNRNAQYAMQRFMDAGYSKQAAAGLVGNFMRESHMNPTAVNANSGAYGIAQFLGPRKQMLFAKYGKKGAANLDNQIDFVLWELDNTHKTAKRTLMESLTPAEAAKNAFGYYEFSGGPEAAVAAMDRTGKNTKWKNPAGKFAMDMGVSWADQLAGINSDTGLTTADETVNEIFGKYKDKPVDNTPAQPPFDMKTAVQVDGNYYPANPTDYGTSIPIVDEEEAKDLAKAPAELPREDNSRNSMALFMNLVDGLNPQTPTVSGNTQRQSKGNSSPFVMPAMPADDDMSLLAFPTKFDDGGYKGGATYKKVPVTQALLGTSFIDPATGVPLTSSQAEREGRTMIADANGNPVPFSQLHGLIDPRADNNSDNVHLYYPIVDDNGQSAGIVGNTEARQRLINYLDERGDKIDENGNFTTEVVYPTNSLDPNHANYNQRLSNFLGEVDYVNSGRGGYSTPRTVDMQMMYPMDMGIHANDHYYDTSKETIRGNVNMPVFYEIPKLHSLAMSGEAGRLGQDFVITALSSAAPKLIKSAFRKSRTTVKGENKAMEEGKRKKLF